MLYFCCQTKIKKYCRQPWVSVLNDKINAQEVLVISYIFFLNFFRRVMKTRAPPPPPLAPQPAPRHIFRNSVLDGGGPSAIDAKDNTAKPYVDFQLTLPQGHQFSVTEDGRWGSREVHTSVHSGAHSPVIVLNAFVLLQSFTQDFILSLLFNIPFISIPKFWNLY